MQLKLYTLHCFTCIINMLIPCTHGVNFITKKNSACEYSVFKLWYETYDNKKQYVDIRSF